MARSLLEIILSVKDKNAKKELKEVDKQLGKVDKAAKASSKGIKNFDAMLGKLALGGGLAAAGIVTLGKAMWNLGKRGAIVEQTEESFDGLIKKLEVTPDLLEDLRKAARGTIDDTTLMSATLTLLAGTSDELGAAMAKATPQLLEIAKAANKLNPALGTTAQLYTDIAKGIKRASPMVLDNLGIVLSLTEVYKNYADSIGKTVEELTKEEQATALLNDVITVSGQNLINQVDGLDAAGDAMARAEVATTKLKDELAKGLYPTIGRLAETINRATPAVFEWLEVNEALEDAFAEGIITGEELLALWSKFDQGGKEAADAWDYLNRQIEDYDFGLQIAGERTGWAAGQSEQLTEALGNVVDATDDATKAQADLKGALSELKLFISGPVGKELDTFKEKQGSLREEYNLLERSIGEITSLDTVSPEQLDQLEEYKGKIGEVRAEMQKNQEEHEKAQKSIVFDLLAQQAAYEGTTTEELAALTTVAEGWDLIDEETKRVTDAVSLALDQLATDENLDNFQTALDDAVKGIGTSADEAVRDSLVPMHETITALEGVHEITFKVNVTGDPIPGSITSKNILTEDPTAGPGHQHGTNFVVPPGFPNDTYPMRVTSGEHVQVTPKGQGGGGVTQNITQNFYDEGAAALGMAVVREGSRSRLNASMGR